MRKQSILTSDTVLHSRLKTTNVQHSSLNFEFYEHSINYESLKGFANVENIQMLSNDFTGISFSAIHGISSDYKKIKK